MNERCQKSKRAYWRKFGGARRPLAAGRFARTGEGRMKGGEPVFGVRCSVFGVRCSVFGVRCSVFGTRMIGRAQAMATGRREPPFAHGVAASGHLPPPAGGAPSARRVATRSPRPPGDERPVSGRASRGRRVAHRA
ncbi:hypothetical protein RZS43_27625, partial [Burkholderia pseudomallei]|uniref:hypothetical protein n=1 Tax=Burkholderia pseudomallei TaxID=28450 RepID=UPI00293201E4